MFPQYMVIDNMAYFLFIYNWLENIWINIFCCIDHITSNAAERNHIPLQPYDW